MNTVSITVPSTLGVNGIAPQELIDNNISFVAHSLATMFGGCTAIKGNGFYVADSGELVQEDVTVITAYNLSDDYTLEDITELAQAIGACVQADMKQECVLVKIDDSVYFV